MSIVDLNTWINVVRKLKLTKEHSPISRKCKKKTKDWKEDKVNGEE